MKHHLDLSFIHSFIVLSQWLAMNDESAINIVVGSCCSSLLSLFSVYLLRWFTRALNATFHIVICKVTHRLFHFSINVSFTFLHIYVPNYDNMGFYYLIQIKVD